MSDRDLAAYTPPPPEPEEAAGGFTVPDGVSDDTPIGRLARRSMASAQPAQQEVLSYSGYGAYADLEDEEDDTFEAADEDSFGTPQDDADLFATPAEPEYGYDSTVRFEDPSEPDYAPGATAEADPAPARSSAASFYAKLVLGMVLVGALSYDPSLLNVALPFAAIALFWLAAFVFVRKIRNGASRVIGGDTRAPRHNRRPDAGAQPLAAGGIDIGGPVKSSRRERGVI